MKSLSKILLPLVVIIGQAAFFFPIAFKRLIGRDEGFYLYAGRLVMEGQLPYQDFFYPQMPILPYFYGVWMKLVGFDWYSARSFSALLSVCTGYLLFEYCRRRFGKIAGLAAVILFAGSAFVYPWFVMAKTYALSTCLLFLAFFFVSLDFKKKHLCYCLSGIALGLAINTRLFFGGLVPFFLAYVFFTKKDQRLSLMSFFLAGLGLALLPNLYFILSSFDAYYFNNLGYHFIRSNRSFADALQHKTRILEVLFGTVDSRKFYGLGYALLLYISLAYMLLFSWKNSKVKFAFVIALCLFVLNYLPTPSYVQYFSTLTPFLIILTIAAFLKCFELAQKLPKPKAYLMQGIVVLFIAWFSYEYFVDLRANIVKYTETGKGVIGISDAKNWRVARIVQISEKLQELAKPGEEVITWWPGYVFGSHARVLAKMENHFGITVGHKLSKEERAEYRIVSKKELLTLLASGQVRLVLLSTQVIRRGVRAALDTGGYKKIHGIGTLHFYEKG